MRVKYNVPSYPVYAQYEYIRFILRNDAGYKGYVSVEYEGGGDPVEGTLKLMEDLVEGINAG